MTYARVIPRDLFNEASLLKCLGHLWLKLEERTGHRAQIAFLGPHQPFHVLQDSSDGSIFCANVLQVHGRTVSLFRPLNSRDQWPLWARFGDPLGDFEDVEVFDESGGMSEDFRDRITQGEAA
jgi:hypothetical protein